MTTSITRFGTRPAIHHHVSVMVLALGGVLGCLGGAALAAPPLPAGTVPVRWSNGVWSTDGLATLTNTVTATGVNQLINQQANAAVYNWNSFNIANGSSVYFNMAQGSGARALNRVMGSSDPSIIQGALGSNGQVYLINQNGIIFDRGAQVNVGALVAGAQNITTPDFLSGQNITSTLPVFGGSNWKTDSDATLIYTPVYDGTNLVGTNLVIGQQAGAAVYNWNSFNIANGSGVYFNMAQGSGARALNRVMGSNDPSVIRGALGSNGQVYLINQNGILFGAGAQVNVGGLVASALNMDTTDFLSGLQSINTTASTFFYDGGGSVPFSGLANATVKVENGASINAASGRVFLFGSQVSNAGRISAADGQVGLAAGSEIYLSLPSVANLRGLLIDVTKNGTTAPAPGTMSVTNTETGVIETARGNTTLAGYFVNQMGRISATTSATANGSIYLQARDSVNAQQLGALGANPSSNLADNTLVKVAGRGGELVLGSGSVTEVRPDGNSDTTDNTKTFYASSVSLSGRLIDMKPGASIVATGGTVTAAALGRFDPVNQITGSGAKDGTLNWSDLRLNGGATAVAQDNARFVMESGASIDVSGAQNVPIAMERNIVTTALLGANDLKDAPLQRNGVLYRSKITFDIRDPVPILGDTSAYVNAIQRGAAEKLSAGGSIKLLSSGDMALAKDSTLNISGGSLAYQGGYIDTTKLVSGGKLYDINNAPANLVYDSIYGTYTVTAPKFGSEATQTWIIPTRGVYQAGYVEGKNAGSITLLSRSISSNATIQAGVTSGPNQRDPASAPQGGILTIGYATDKAGDGTNIVNPDYVGPDVRIASAGTGLPTSFWADPAAAAPGTIGGTVVLDANSLSNSRLAKLNLYTSGSITQDAGVNLKLAPGGSLTAIASSANLGGNIQAQGGSVGITTKDTIGHAEGDIVVAGVIDTSGGWVNDGALLNGPTQPTTPVRINGGSISLQGNGIDVQGSAMLDVSGGAQLTSTGKLNLGNGGRIVLASGGTSIDGNGNVTQAVGTSSQWLSGALRIDGQLRGAAPGKGGSLALGLTEAVRIGGTAGAGEMGFDTGFFGRGGFTDYTIASVNGLTLSAGTQLAPRAQTLVFGGNYGTAATGTPMASLTGPSQLPDGQRTPVNLSLQAVGDTNGRLAIESGASINTDPGATVSLVAGRQLTVDGSINAPAGAINLTLQPADNNPTPGLLDRSIWLGGQSVLSAAGTFVPTIADGGLSKGNVLAGGAISIDLAQGATKGATGMLVAQQGAVLDVRGASATIDLASPGGAAQPTVVGSNGGSITLKTFDGGFFDATMLASGGTSSAAGGQFNAIISGVSLSGGAGSNGALHVPGGTQSVVLSDGSSSLVPPGAQPGGTFDPSLYGGQLQLRTDKLNQAGFADVSLSGENRIQATGSIGLNALGSVTLNSPNIDVAPGAVFDVTAPYVKISNLATASDNTSGNGKAAPGATGGSGTLAVNANLIDLAGSVSLTGVGSTNLNSAGDIRFIVAGSGSNPFSGAFNTAGDLGLTSAQAYPTTGYAGEVDPANPLNWSFNLNVPGHTITFASNGAAAATPLSAGGSLLVTANNIVQGGVLRAPQGRLSLVATGNLTLTPGSLTSVSADGLLIPYGSTVNGSDWTYGALATSSNTLSEPGKSLNLNGLNVALAAGAKVDVSGGGNLYAYEFVPGSGGSTDILANSNAYAIMPSLGKNYAPYDAVYSLGSRTSPTSASTLRVGDTITLGAGSGVPAGTYTLLPARYALLPGAYLVKPVAGYQDMQAGVRVPQADGSAIVAGYRGSLNNDTRDARSSGWLVEPAAVVRSQAQYNDSYGNSFFSSLAAGAGTAAPRNVADAGIIAISAAQSLNLDATLKLDGADGGRGAAVDIASGKIAVTDGTAGLGDSYRAQGYLVLDSTKLNVAGIESLILGGTRDNNGVITTVATDVVLDSAHAALTGSDVVLTAGNNITVGDGSAIVAGKLSNADVLRTSGAGALLRVAGSDGAAVTRTGATPGNATLNVGANTRLGAAAAGDSATVILDSTNITRVDASATLNATTAGIAAGSIAAGAVPGGTPGLTLGTSLLDQFGQARNLTLKSYSSIDFYGTANLGSAGLNNLTLDAYALAGRGAGAVVNITGGQVTLANTSGANALSTAPTTLGTGSLNIAATGNLVTGAGVKTLQGFGTVNLTAGRELSLQNNGSTGSASLAASGATATDATALTITAARISGATGANQTISTTGHLEIDHNAASGSLAAPTGLGAKLTLSGNDVRLAGTIDLPSGSIAVNATGGTAADNLLVAAGTVLRAAGSTTTFDGLDTYAPAGRIDLKAAGGSVRIGGSDVIDVSGAAGGGNAGTFTASSSQGTVAISSNATLLGSAAAGYTSGSASFEGQTLIRLDSTNIALNRGGFAEERDFRAHTGNLVIGSGANAAVSARNVSLEADGENGNGGNISINNTVGGAYATAGAVRVSSATGVSLVGNGQLVAKATGAGNAGGSAYVASTSSTAANLSLGGRGVDVGGGAGAAGGTFWVRAPQAPDSSGDAMGAVAPITGPIAGASSVVLEGVKTYAFAGNVNVTNGVTSNSTTLALGSGSTPAAGTILGDAQQFMLNAPAIAGRVGGSVAVDVRAGAEVDAAGSINVTTALDFFPASASTARPEQRGGALTLRAGGNLNISGSISDGFTGGTAISGVTGVAANSLLQIGDGTGQTSVPTWSYRLVGGADLKASDTRRTIASTTGGDVLIGAGASETSATDVIVRTATGSIEIAAGRNVQLRNSQATVYTTGAGTSLGTGLTFTNPAFIGASTNPFTSGGGSIRIDAQNDVLGPSADNQVVTNWLFRQQKSNPANPQTAWWTRYDLFRQGVATFGGGDVTVHAGRDIKDFSASTATNARLPADAGGAAAGLVVQGGGALNIQAGRDIAGGMYYEGRGTASLNAGGALTAGSSRSLSGSVVAFDPILALQDGIFNVTTSGDLGVSGIFNPTIAQSTSLDTAASAGSFSSYGSASAVNLLSLRGNVAVRPGVGVNADGTDANAGINAIARLRSGSGTGANNAGAGLLQNANQTFSNNGYTLAPGIVNAIALAGDVRAGSSAASVTLMPAAQGNLNLLAQGNVTSVVNLIDRPASGANSLATMFNAPGAGAVTPVTATTDSKGYALTHLGDPTPARLVALTGDVTSGLLSNFIGKSAHLVAGRDIKILLLAIENANPSDQTLVQAGRDYIGGNQVNYHLTVDGPGQVVVQAGRNVDLGISAGIVTRGNTVNSLLDDHGASLTVIAGVAGSPDYAALGTKYLSAYGAYAAAYLNLGDALIGGYMSEITVFMRKQPGAGGLDQWAALTQFLALPAASQSQLLASLAAKDTFLASLPAFSRFLSDYSAAPVAVTAAAVSRFEALPAAQQQPFLQRLAIAELGSAGNAAALASGQAAKDAAYQRGYAAIATMFPGSSYKGDLLMFSSQIKTQDGGDITVFVPGGMVNAGVAVLPANSKAASDLGILTVGGGDINAVVDGDFQVNQSRVFTLAGGGILMWSSNGSLNAGRGAKTATSAPAPVLRLDKDGNLILDYSGAVSGSGIGTVITNKAIPGGDVILVAPKGFVDAGDAGIFGEHIVVPGPTLHSDAFAGVVVGQPTQTSQSAPPPPPDSGGSGARKTVDQITQNAEKSAGGGGETVKSNVFTGFGE